MINLDKLKEHQQHFCIIKKSLIWLFPLSLLFTIRTDFISAFFTSWRWTGNLLADPVQGGVP